MQGSRLAVLLVLVSGLLLLAPPAPAAPREQELVDRLNAVRASHGLAPLRRSPALEGSAYAYARHLMRVDWFGHGSTIAAGGSFGSLGEALAWHPGWKAERSGTVRTWLHSAAHRALVLSPGFRYAGAGRARGSFGGALATIWVLQLGGR